MAAVSAAATQEKAATCAGSEAAVPELLELLGGPREAAAGSHWSWETASRDGRHVVVRPYEPESDQPRLVDLCRGNYGGHDELPGLVAAADGDTGVEFLVVDGAGSETDSVIAFGGIVLRENDLPWIFGLRTRRDHQGRGLAKLVVRSLMTLAAAQGRTLIMSATVLANPAARTIFRSLGFRMVQGVHVWPHIERLHKRLTASAAVTAKGELATQESLPRMLDGVPMESEAAMEELADRWVPCTDINKLEKAVSSARTGARHCQNGHYVGADGAGFQMETSDEPLWLPMYFQIWAPRGQKVAAALANGSVWVLEPARRQITGAGGKLESQAQVDAMEGMDLSGAGALIMQQEPDYHNQVIVGMVASSASIATSALLFASRRHACFQSFVDLRDTSRPGGGLAGSGVDEAWVGSRLARLFPGESGESFNYIVLQGMLRST
eukprot:SM000237S08136  [mRNA]  locus=s237:131988:134343:- [translate_table: standard]